MPLIVWHGNGQICRSTGFRRRKRNWGATSYAAEKANTEALFTRAGLADVAKTAVGVKPALARRSAAAKIDVIDAVTISAYRGGQLHRTYRCSRIAAAKCLAHTCIVRTRSTIRRYRVHVHRKIVVIIVSVGSIDRHCTKFVIGRV
jgi:hypothetical protein